jgi:hypothetical protein
MQASETKIQINGGLTNPKSLALLQIQSYYFEGNDLYVSSILIIFDLHSTDNYGVKFWSLRMSQ